MSASPSVLVEWWGPCSWKLMHSIAFTMPDNPTQRDREHYAQFFESLSHVLPCPSCREHMAKHIVKNPPDTTGPIALARWVYDMHDIVNKYHEKTSPPFEDVVKAYTNGVDTKRLMAMTEPRRRRALADPYIVTPPSREKSLGAPSASLLDDFPAEWLIGAGLVLGLVGGALILARRSHS